MTQLKELLLLILIFSLGISKAQTAKVFIDNDNVHVAFVDGNSKKLTFNKSDKSAILLKEKVVFVRTVKADNGGHQYDRFKIMTVDVKTLMEEVIADQKPYKDGNDNTYEILNVIDLTPSNDNKSIYFITEKFATSNQVVKVDIDNGNWTALFPAETFELVRKGAFKDYFLVGKSEIRERGRDVYYEVCNESGEVVKEFDSADSLMEFRSQM